MPIFSCRRLYKLSNSKEMNNKQLLDEVLVECRIIKVEDNSYRDIDNFANHKNRMQ